MNIAHGNVSRILVFGSMWIILASLWVIYWPSQVSFRPVVRYFPKPFGDVADPFVPPPGVAATRDPIFPTTRRFRGPITRPKNKISGVIQRPHGFPEDYGQDKPGNAGAGSNIFPAIAKAAGRIKEKISFGESISEDEKRRPWRYPVKVDRTQLGTEKATLLMLARNDDLYAVRESMRRLEDRFNHKFRYPWTFMNDEPFTEEFIAITTGIASGKTEYVRVPKEHWGFPSWVNQTHAKLQMKKMADEHIIYGGSLSYRHMCRFFSGFFFRQPVMQQYEWYWRVEPGVNFYCDQHYDPFRWLRENGKSYGFTVTLHDFRETIASLWETTERFFYENPEYVDPNNMRGFVIENTTRNGEPYVDYNTCHFWTNFEIGKVSLWTSEKYLRYFDYLDKTGNFFYERWGDAPVHSVALTHMWDKKEIHFFNDIGYEHSPFRRCPQAHEHGNAGRCLCPLDMSLVDNNGFSCFEQWKKTFGDNYEVDLTW
ncbi:hypothetical protein TWF703_010394 [Orbilia oligospora]|uniref:Alpha 1,2-mannosyltransferase 2.4.1 n=1 Tax=Orbilia oligospora TaxID=2813651 RepID=A0A7C8NNR5_ORBOL|nr:hypothetical protein TWF703_010394 [Orbilia oligospora]